MTAAERTVQRKLGNTGFDYYIIGDIEGKTTEGLPIGYIRVSRYEGGAYRSTKQVLIADADTCFYVPTPGYPVVITASRYRGEEVVKGTDTFSAQALGFDIGFVNPGNPTYNNAWVKMQNATLLLVVPRNPADLMVDVNPYNWLDSNGTWHGFPGEKDVDLTAEVAALTGIERALAVIYLKDDQTCEVVVSTPVDGPESIDPITNTQLQECQDAAPANSIPAGAFVIRAGMTQITWSDRWGDIRQWINVPIYTSSLLTNAVILDPGSSTRNVITPTGNFSNLVLKASSSSQTEPMLELQTEAGTGFFRIYRLSGATANIMTLSGQFRIDGLDLDGSTLSTHQTNQNLSITPNGSGLTVIKNPQITTFNDSQHNHQNAAGGGQLNASSVFSAGQVPLTRGGTGVDNSAAATGGVAIKTSATEVKIVQMPLLENALLNSDFSLADDASSVSGAATGSYICDIWRYFKTASTAVVDLAQDTDVPTVAQAGQLISNSLKIDFPTADASVGSGDLIIVRQAIEGYRFARMLAQRPMVLRFWVKSDITGTMGVGVGNNVDRTYLEDVVINATGTWELKSMLIPASPSGGTWDYTTGIGLNAFFTLMAGSTYQGTAGSWQSSSIFATSNQTNFAGTNNNTVWITKPVLVSMDTLVDTIPVMERDRNEERRLIERYFWKIPGGSTTTNFCTGFVFSTTLALGTVQFPQQMRAAPTLSNSGSFEVSQVGTVAISSLAIASATQRTAQIQATVASGLTAGRGMAIRAATDANAYMSFNARL